MEIRSYRRVFALERRIYRIDRLRLNPSGLPVRGFVYFLVLLATTVIFDRLPLSRIVAGIVPWYLRYVALPGVAAATLTIISVDGRPFHLAAHALLRHWTGRRLSVADRERAWLRRGSRPRREAGSPADFTPRQSWHPEPIVMIPDGSDARMRRLRYTGPGAVLVAVGHERTGRVSERGRLGFGRTGRRPGLIVRELPGSRSLSRGTVIALASGARLLVKPERQPNRMGEHSTSAALPDRGNEGRRR